MVLFNLFCTLTLVKATHPTHIADRLACDGIIFQEVYYDREVLFSNLGRPYNLVPHKYTGKLFFSHTIHDGSQVDFGIMMCHLDSKQCKPIVGIPGGYAINYDAKNDDLYFGGHDGIYKYKYLTTEAEYFCEYGKSIWDIFIGRNFYYIEYPSQRLYMYDTDKFIPVKVATNIEMFNFFETKKLDVYFSNETALFKVDRHTKHDKGHPFILNDEVMVHQIVEDNYGDVYFCSNDGIYLEDKPYKRIKRVAEVDRCFGMTFDENQRIIYSDKSNIYRLNPSSDAQYCYDKVTYVEQRRK